MKFGTSLLWLIMARYLAVVNTREGCGLGRPKASIATGVTVGNRQYWQIGSDHPIYILMTTFLMTPKGRLFFSLGQP